MFVAQPRRAAVAVVLAVAALGAGLIAGPAGASSGSQLSAVVTKLKQVQSSLSAAQGTAGKLAAEIRATSAQLAAAQATLAQDREQVMLTRLASRSAAATLAVADRRVGGLTALVQARARAAYMAGDVPAALAALAASSNVTDLLDRVAMLNFVAEQGQAQLAQLQAAQQFAAASGARYLVAVRAAAAAEHASQAEIRRLTALQARQERAQAAFQARITALANESAALRAKSTELQGLVTQEQVVQQQVGTAPTVHPSGGLCPLAGVSAAEQWIIMHESGDNPYAQNPASTAFGLGQLLLGNRIAFLGPNYATTSCALQLQAFRAYVKERYGTAEAAMAFWEAHDWY